jgi:hypothetical protein
VHNDFLNHGAPFLFLLIVIGAVLLITLLIHVFVCWLLYDAFGRIPARFREMDPGLVWLLLVPCFSLVWSFFVYPKIARSFKAYFNSIGDPTVGDCGEQLGLFAAIAGACTLVPCVNYIATPAMIVLVIVFLIKAHELKRRIPPGTV